jgi:predicted AAA+ superfamily ATPase
MKRAIENQLLAWKNIADTKAQRLPLILLGARQVGKTYTLKKFAQENFPQYHYVNCEKQRSIAEVFNGNLDPKTVIDNLSLALNTPINKNSDLIILDEIQAVPHALTALKYFAEEMSECAIIAAGSLLGLKLNEVSFPVGKVDYLHMYPFTFFEFLQGIGDDLLLEHLQASLKSKSIKISNLLHEKLWEKLKVYFVVGGLPAAINTYKESKVSAFEKFEQVRATQEKLIASYFDDMSKHSGKENAMNIERLWENIPNQLVREQDSSSSRFRFKGVIPGIKSYSNLVGIIDWLEAAKLIIKVKIVNHAGIPLSAHTQENRFKLFCFDCGLLGALSELKPSEILNYNYGEYKGYFAENFVAQELSAKNFKHNNLYAWSEGTAEIEFVINTDQGIIPIEVKSGSNTQAKSLQSFRSRYNQAYEMILNAKNISIEQERKLYKYPLYLAALVPSITAKFLSFN